MEDLPITPTTPTTDSTQSLGNHTQAKMMFLLGAILVVGAIVAGGFFYFSQATKKMAYDDTIVNNRVAPAPEGANANLTEFNNPTYGISFTLNPGEEVTECPLVDESNDSLRLWISGAADSRNVPDCASENVTEGIFVSKKSSFKTVDDYLAALGDPETGYTLTKNSTVVSGKTVDRVIGKKTTAANGGAPENIDVLVFDHNGALYAIPARYLDRNLQVK